MVEDARSSRYRYLPLQDTRNIRVLDVSPGEHGNEIHFALREVKLEESGLYHALSYVWGPPIFSETIFSANGYLKTTLSLYAALQRFRAPDQTVVFWADAVCINQEDLQERGQQVSFMRSIYTTSASVLIWLGDATEFDQEACNFILQFTDKHIKGSLDDAFNELDDWNLDSIVRVDKIKALRKNLFLLSNTIQVSEVVDDNLANGLTHFFSRDWFLRIWTVQEVASARAAVVKCGSLTLDYGIVERFAEVWRGMGMHAWLRSSAAQGSVPQLGEVSKFRDERKTGKPQHSLVSIAHQLRSRQATDSRDKLYGLFGLASNPQPLPYAPSYMVTTEQLYLDLAAKEIKDSRSLEVFQFCFFNENSHLPSWAPDWRTYHPSADLINRSTEPFCAYRYIHWSQTDEDKKKAEDADEVLWDIYTTIDGSNLFVRAFIFDTPKQAIPHEIDFQPRMSQGWQVLKPILQKYLEFMEKSARATAKSFFYPDAARQEEAWWRTFIGDRQAHGFQAEEEFKDRVLLFGRQ